MKKHILLLALCTSVISISSLFAQTFNHPGAMHSKSDLDFIKSKVAAGQEPWKTAYNNLKASNYASLTYVATPFAEVLCGSFNKPNQGCDEVLEDPIAAYTMAIRWYIEGDARYADKSIAILMAWCNTFQKADSSNARLISCSAATWFVNAAEILRYTYPNWTTTHTNSINGILNKFKTKMFWEDRPNNNWMTISLEARLSVAVFQNDRVAFDDAIAKWKFRIKTYIYETIDGPTPINGTTLTTAQTVSIWRSTATSTSYVDGMSMETCRDMNHCKMGFDALINGAEVAWNQNIDLFSLEKERIKDFLELHGSWFLGTPVPANICGGVIDFKGTPTTAQTAFELAYSHLHDRLGIAMPNTAQMIANKRPSGAGVWIHKWETVGYANRSFAVIEPNSAPVVEIITPNTSIVSVFEGYSLSVLAQISDVDNNFSSSSLQINGTLIRNEATAPYEWGHATSPNPNELNNLPVGTHIIKVTATDTKGAVGSDEFTLEVKEKKAPFTGTPITIPGIIEAENYDKGGEGISYHDVDIVNTGATYRTDGVDIGALAVGNNVGWTAAGEWLEYTVSISEAALYDFQFLISSLNGGGIISLNIDGTILQSNISIPSTGNWNTYAPFTSTIVLPAGTHILRLNVQNIGFNIDKITVVKTIRTQTIPLNKGWNLISTNVTPTNNAIAAMFSGLDVQEIKTANCFWLKSQNAVFNSIQTISAGQGYLVKMNVAGNLVVSGTPISTLAYSPISTLKTGWNLVGCPYQTSTPFSTYFNAANTKVIKNFDGFWIPNDPLSSITNLLPGKGYYIKK